MTCFLVTGARAPVAVHLARLLNAAGHRVVLADSLRHTVGSVCKAGTYAVLPAANGDQVVYADALKRIIATHAVSVVVPTCEEVFHLAEVWRDQDMGAALFAPPIEMLSAAHNKFAFQGLVKSLGLAAPQTRLLASSADLEAVRKDSRALVFKPVWSRFATQVLVRPEPNALRIQPTVETPWVAQEFCEGIEICAYALARNGTVHGIAAYQPRYRAGKGAGIYLMPESDPAITDFITQFVAGTDWTGQVSFDFIRTDDGAVLPLECNPRAVSGLHFFQDGAEFAGALLGHGSALPDLTTARAVRLAMWAYGLPNAIRHRKPLRLLRDMKGVPDVLDWPDDPAPKRHQIRAMAEMMGIALRHRTDLLTATTYDIAWNGPR